MLVDSDFRVSRCSLALHAAHQSCSGVQYFFSFVISWCRSLHKVLADALLEHDTSEIDSDEGLYEYISKLKDTYIAKVLSAVVFPRYQKIVFDQVDKAREISKIKENEKSGCGQKYSNDEKASFAPLEYFYKGLEVIIGLASSNPEQARSFCVHCIISVGSLY